MDDWAAIAVLKSHEHKGAVDKKTAVTECYSYTVEVIRKDDLQFDFECIKKYKVVQKISIRCMIDPQ